MAVTSEQALWFQDAFSKLVDNVDKAILGKARGHRARARRAAVRRARAARGLPGNRQDRARQGAREHARRHQFPHPVHARPAALGCHGRHDLRPGQGPVRVPPRADLRLDRAGRRDQPSEPEDAVGAPGGHGGGQGHGRRRELRGGFALHGHRHAEPRGAGGHVHACPRRSSTDSSSRPRSGTPTTTPLSRCCSTPPIGLARPRCRRSSQRAL